MQVQKEKGQPALKEYGVEADKHWMEVMYLAEKYGFILQAYGGTAVLATHQNQLTELGEAKYLQIQQMNSHCPKNCGYPGCLTPEGVYKECGSCWAVQKGPRWLRFEMNPQYKSRQSGG